MSELVAVCYRMSDVVSPVVQSSSPEGLIPMDTDSGNRGHYLEELKKGVKVTFPPLHTKRMEYVFLGRTPREDLVIISCVRLDRDVRGSAEDPAGDPAQRHQRLLHQRQRAEHRTHGRPSQHTHADAEHGSVRGPYASHVTHH